MEAGRREGGTTTVEQPLHRLRDVYERARQRLCEARVRFNSRARAEGQQPHRMARSGQEWNDLRAAEAALNEALLPLVAANDPQLTKIDPNGEITDEYVGRLAAALSPMQWRMWRQGPHNTHVQVVWLFYKDGVTDVGAARLQAALVEGCGVVEVNLDGTSVTPWARAGVFEQCCALACRQIATDAPSLKDLSWWASDGVPSACWPSVLDNLAEALPGNTHLRSLSLPGPVASAWADHAGLKAALRQCNVWKAGNCEGGEGGWDIMDAVTANLIRLLAANDPDPGEDLYEESEQDRWLWYRGTDCEYQLWDISKLGDVADALRGNTHITRIDTDEADRLAPDTAADVALRLKNAIPFTRLTSLCGLDQLTQLIGEEGDAEELCKLVFENGVRLTAADEPTHRYLDYYSMNLDDDDIDSLVSALMGNRHLRSINLSYNELSDYAVSQLTSAVRECCVERIFDDCDSTALQFNDPYADSHLVGVSRDVHAELIAACRNNAYRRHARIAYRPHQRLLLAEIGNRFSACGDLAEEICGHLDTSLLCPMQARGVWEQWEFAPRSEGVSRSSARLGNRGWLPASDLEWHGWEAFLWEQSQHANADTGAKRQRTG